MSTLITLISLFILINIVELLLIKNGEHFIQENYKPSKRVKKNDKFTKDKSKELSCLGYMIEEESNGKKVYSGILEEIRERMGKNEITFKCPDGKIIQNIESKKINTNEKGQPKIETMMKITIDNRPPIYKRIFSHKTYSYVKGNCPDGTFYLGRSNGKTKCIKYKPIDFIQNIKNTEIVKNIQQKIEALIE